MKGFLAGTAAFSALLLTGTGCGMTAAKASDTWSGLFGYGAIGYGTGSTAQYGVTPSPGQWTTAGHMAGLGVASYRQMNWLVLGAAADFSKADISGERQFGIFTNVPWVGTARAVVGVAASSRWMVYGTGGAAIARIDSGNFNASGGETAVKIGWSAGAGVGFQYGPSWSVTLDYMHIDFGTVRYDKYSTSAPIDVLRLGLQLRLARPSGP